MALWIVLAALAFGVYTYFGYPIVLTVVARLRGREPWEDIDGPWPLISITVPAYNEEHQIAETIESLLALDYPADRREIVIVSDASSDRTDEIVHAHPDPAVRLIRQHERKGKTAAERLAADHLTGEIVVNTDASIRIQPDSLKRLIAPLRDPEVGLASGRDISVGSEGAEANQGEANYVGYEMWVRDLETRVRGIVGASGCFYAIRADLHRTELPEALSRDFASALHTREAGLRAVSVPNATCTVPRAPSLKKEYHRKVRTMARGMETLAFKRSLLNPLSQGVFAWMLFSHKICRWLLPWIGCIGLISLTVLALSQPLLTPVAALGWIVVLVGLVAWSASGDRPLPSVFALPAYAVMGNVAAMKALLLAIGGDKNPIWEPTRRNGPSVTVSTGSP